MFDAVTFHLDEIIIIHFYEFLIISYFKQVRIGFSTILFLSMFLTKNDLHKINLEGTNEVESYPSKQY